MTTNTAPSREFMIGQAVLNFLAHQMPSHLRTVGTVGSLEWLMTLMNEDGWIHRQIQREYLAIAARYQVQV